jgi:cell division protein FtsQ
MSPRVVSVDGRPVRRWRLVRMRGGSTVRRFAARTRRRRLRASMPYLLLALVLLIGAGGVWTVYDTRVLDVRAVAVDGANVLTPDEVRAAAAVPIGSALARVDTAGVERRVRALKPVATVEVSRAWPHTLTISVHERVAVAVVARGSTFLLLDRSGLAYTVAEHRPSGLTLLDLRTPAPGDRATIAALSTIAALPPAIRHQLISISAPTGAQVTLVLAAGRTVFWGDADNSAAKAVVATALLARPGKRIDVSAPDVVTTR